MIAPEWYDREYYEGPTKSEYQPYGPGDWADWLSEMLMEHLHPTSVLDVGCAYGFVVERLLWHDVQAHGFDHSSFAVQRTALSGAHIWRGDVADPAAWRNADLILCAEVLEHLTDEQAAAFFALAARFGSRGLVLVTTEGTEHSDTDESHINLKPIEAWQEMARRDWELGDATAFNTDVRSVSMGWAGRFMLLSRPLPERRN